MLFKDTECVGNLLQQQQEIYTKQTQYAENENVFKMKLFTINTLILYY